ncbi:RES family NAD+ phosphorylase [Caenimonas terrae]|uniref:RES family NAD+ phosphorylase n=1 Tax=Caenimonas terrae TaxID=696074 RepID=A0ABW0NMA6_9BURK
MIHDSELLDKLADLPREAFAGRVYRATRKRLDPLLTSRSGGRWMPPGGAGVLYTSFEREGALAEICFHWSQWTPRPSKPATIHTLNVVADRTLKLVRANLEELGVAAGDYEAVNLPRTQQIGAAVEFLGCDGLIVPSARWACDNLILFPDSADFRGTLVAELEEDVDWLKWGKEKKLVD